MCPFSDRENRRRDQLRGALDLRLYLIPANPFFFQMLDKAQSWEDCLWAYYKTVVDLTIEDVLQRSPHINRPWQYVENISLPDDYYLQRRDLNDVKEIFNKIASTSDKVSD